MVRPRFPTLRSPSLRRLAALVSRIAFAGIPVLAASLLAPAPLPAVVINEIMYHSEEPDDKPVEWIELFNEHLDPLDLGGWSFCNGVDFVFPESTWLEGYSYVVVCRDVSALRAKYGDLDGIVVVGGWDGQLSNSGERLELCNPGGVPVIAVRYNDRGKWPVAADGAGHSLALVDPYGEMEDADNWQQSLTPGGTPGRWNGFRPRPEGGVVAFNGMDGSGFILDWLLLGPYEGAGCGIGTTAIRADWLTEGDGSPNQTDLEWRDGQVVRTSYSTARSTGLHPNAPAALPTVTRYEAVSDTINLNDAVYSPDPDDVMAYAFTYVDNVTGAPLAVTLGCGSDDSIAILLNGTYMHVNDVCRGAGGAGEVQDRVDAVLQPGKNLIAVKIFERGGGWAFRLRIEERSTNQAIVSPSRIQITSDVDAGLGFDGSGEPILPVDDPGGGPGDEPSDGLAPVVINEALLRTSGDRWIELYNRSSETVDLSGHWFTDDPSTLEMVEIADGVTIAPGAFLLLTETDLGLDLAITDVRDRVFVALVEPDGSVMDAYNFEPAFDEHSEARIPDGDREFDDAAEPTPGEPNEILVNDQVVINEVMYHSIDDDPDKEYIELFNRSDAAVDLTGWAITRGIDFAFSPGTTIPAGGYLVVARSPETIRSIHSLPESAVVGPPSDDPEAIDDFGGLQNSGERITLKDAMDRTVDTVSFRDGGEWPRWADGHGSSMELIDPFQDNRFGQAWDASDDSAKAEERTLSYVGRHAGGESELHVLLLSRGIALVDDISVVDGGVTYLDTPLVDDDEVWRFVKGTEAPPVDWNEPGFDDGDWLSGPTGIGYGDGDDVTELDDMRDNYRTIFCRKTFTVDDPSAIEQLWLSITVDDGFHAYLNGDLVASFNVSGTGHEDDASSAGEPQLVERSLSVHLSKLVPGENVLAVQVHNAGLGSSDLTFIPRLVDRRVSTGGGTEKLANGDFEANDDGWVIEGTHWRSGRSVVDPIAGSGSLKIVASGRGDNKVNRIETPEPDGSGLGTLSTGEDIQVSLKARWIVGSQTLLTHGYRHSMARAHDLHVPENLGTPGRPNSVSARQDERSGGNLGPVFTDLEQDPAVPVDGEDVVVTVRVTDSDGLQAGSVVLHYSLDNPSAVTSNLVMASVGGDRYRATIPGRGLGTRVVFHVTARDDLGEAGRFPVDVTRRTHPLLLDPSSPGIHDHRYFIYRHDVYEPTTPYKSYRFVMTEADESRLDGRRHLSNDLIPGSLVVGGDRIFHEAWARFSGSPFARGRWGSFRVALPRDDLLQGTIRKFNLDNHHGSGQVAKERFSHYLLSKNQGAIRVPYSHLQTLVRWQVNARSLGIREQVWVPDVQFLSMWWPDDDDGDFLEMDDRFVIDDSGNRVGNTDGRVLYPPSSHASDGDGGNKENYRWFFGLRAKNGADDYSRFIEFCRLMDPGQTSTSTFDERVWDLVNVEEMLRVWAVRLNTDDWDEWGANRGKNCYFYQPTVDGRWNLLAWDMELTYGNVNSFLIPDSPTQAFNPGGFSEVHRLLNRPRVKRMYYSILAEMVSGPDRWFHSSYLSAYASRLAQIGMSDTDIGMPGGYVDSRSSLLSTRIRSAIYPQAAFRITTNGGNGFETDTLRTSLAGLAPVDSSYFVVTDAAGGDVAYPAEFSSLTSWRIDDILLHPGVNEVQVITFDLRGDYVAADSISVTSTATAWDPPTLTSVTPSEAVPGDSVTLEGDGFHDGLTVLFGDTPSTDVTYDEDGPTPGVAVAEVPEGAGTTEVRVQNVDGKESTGLPFRFLDPPPRFVRGDANGDGVVDLSDPVRTLLHLFGGVAVDCEDAADADDDEGVSLTDAVYLLEFLFRGGSAPLAPFPGADVDPDGEGLGCER